MDIYRELAGGDRRSIGRADAVAAAVARNPDLFGPLFDGMLHKDPVVAMRCADAAEKVTRLQPGLLGPYGQRLLEKVGHTEQHEVRWHVALMLPRARLSAAQRRQAMELLRVYLNDASRIVCCNALEGLTDLAEQDDVLRPVIRRIVRQHTGNVSAAVRARARKMLIRLETEP